MGLERASSPIIHCGEELGDAFREHGMMNLLCPWEILLKKTHCC
jgi:hypothetical protein